MKSNFDSVFLLYFPNRFLYEWKVQKKMNRVNFTQILMVALNIWVSVAEKS